jgi:hypothetical protein
MIYALYGVVFQGNLTVLTHLWGRLSYAGIAGGAAGLYVTSVSAGFNTLCAWTPGPATIARTINNKPRIRVEVFMINTLVKGKNFYYKNTFKFFVNN